MLAFCIVNACCDLGNSRKTPLRNFTLKTCLFGATKIVKNSDKSKWKYSGYEITFNWKGEWDFGNVSDRNVVIFRVDNSSSSRTDNRKNDFSVLGEGLVSINGGFGAPEKKSLKQRQNFSRFWITMMIIVICLLTGKKV